MKKLLLLGIMLLGMGGANYAHELDKCVHELDKKITFEEALISTDPFVIVQDGKVLCGPLSSTDGSLTFKDVTEISDYAYSFKFEDAMDNCRSGRKTLHHQKRWREEWRLQ